MGSAQKVSKQRISHLDGADAVYVVDQDHSAGWTNDAITASDSDPTASEGLDVSNGRYFCVLTHSFTTTSHDLVVWVKGGSDANWSKLYDSAGNVVQWTGLTGVFATAIEVVGWDRMFVQVANFTGGGNVDRETKVC